MKTITLKVYKEEINGRQTFLTTYDLLKSVINQPNREGFNIDEMQTRLRLLGIIDKHKAVFEIKEGEFKDEMLDLEVELEMEDADFKKMSELFKEMKWGIISSAIIDVNNRLLKS